jgi:hypothetical protein
MIEWDDTLRLQDVIVGFIKDKIFYTYRRPEHFMRKYGGFGISVKILNQLIERNIKDIIFIYEGKKEKSMFATTTMKILGLGIVEWDYTFGFEDKQYFIPLSEMEKTIMKPEDYKIYFSRNLNF